MKIRVAMLPATLMLVGACVSTVDTAQQTGEPQFLTELPEAVRERAAPYQNLNAVQLRSDGCYWYRHVGPVETTFLPLRSVAGRPICARLPDAPATPA